jgi:hypothetical protein
MFSRSICLSHQVHSLHRNKECLPWPLKLTMGPSTEPNPHQSGFLTDSPHQHRCLFLMAQPMRSIINIGRGYHLQSFEHENKPLSIFPSNILHFPLVALPDLILCHILKAKTHNPHRITITRSSPITSGFRPLVLYR